MEDRFYNENANPRCADCGGKGMLTFYWSHDDAKAAPCVRCFPADDWAKSNEAAWHRSLR